MVHTTTGADLAGSGSASPAPFSDEQSAAFRQALDLLAQKTLEDETKLGVGFPYVTDADGLWKTMMASRSAGYEGGAWSHGNWFCGFWVGLLLAAYLHRGDAVFLELARERMRLVAPRGEDPNTHDIGFIFLSSALPAFHITGDPWYAGLALAAANRLRARLVTTPRGSYISSWGPLSDPRGRSSSAIDTMANLPLLYWAADYADDGSFRAAAEAHAIMTKAAFVRPDFSTYHAVEYDLKTGARLRGYTFQGHSHESFWSRGQGWAVLGYAATAEATRNDEHLALSCRLADVFLERLRGTAIPPWDFDDPAGSEAPRDSSAGAILANGLLRISTIHPDGQERSRRRREAIGLLYNLCTNALAVEPGHRGLLKHGCYSRPHSEGVDSAVLFGDFYFVDALCRATMPGEYAPEAQPLPA